MIILTVCVSLLVTVSQANVHLCPHPICRKTPDGGVSVLSGPGRPSEAEAQTSRLPGPEFVPKGHCRAN